MMEQGVARGDSIFTPGYPVWTLSAARDFEDRFITKGDTGQDSFMGKLKGQLDGAPRATVQLAAELLYVYLLPPAPESIGLAKKREILAATLDCSSETVQVPAELERALGSGFARTGAAYNNKRFYQLSYLIHFLITLRELPPERQEAIAHDPRRFRELAYAVPVQGAQSMRNALLHLAFPNFFEDTVSDTHKDQIATAFDRLVSSRDANVDEKILEIRGGLERQLGRTFDFYDPDIRAQWGATPEPIDRGGGPGGVPQVEVGGGGGTPAPADQLLADATPALAAKLLIDFVWLNETIDLLREKGQLILYGPPGTGKTYLAQALAEHCVQAKGGAYELVQFHPSYAYEDFFEGFRPRTGDQKRTISFDLAPGPFKLLALRAAENPERPYILVIDEINRANLSKVFGELYFLLEYRDRKVSLQYSPHQDFTLPRNLYLIGTMNTSDRSIALVDAAMRRRFNWRPLFPDRYPVQGLLRRWLDSQHLPQLAADFLDALNAQIEDRDGKIGPSYLMTKVAGQVEGIRRIWEHQILPLLEERHAGEGVDVPQRYGIDALMSSGGTPAAAAPAAGAVEQ